MMQTQAADAHPCWGSVAHCDWTSPGTNDLVAAERLRSEESQVLVGVVLVLAVRRKVEERQLLVTALKLEDFAAQVQTALRTPGKKNSLNSGLSSAKLRLILGI